MDRVSANPLFVVLFFGLRCVIPLMIMLSISYLLRKFGLVQAPSEPPVETKSITNGDQPNDPAAHV
jgi:hypothetical protein